MLFSWSGALPDLHSFPTRRSSDLQSLWGTASDGQTWGGDANKLSLFSISGGSGVVSATNGTTYSAVLGPPTDRKSTRLNSSHANISYAVFCVKNKCADGNNWYKAF